MTYPKRHCYHGLAISTKTQMQGNNGNDNHEDTQSDNECEIHHYRHNVALFILYYILVILCYVMQRHMMLCHITLNYSVIKLFTALHKMETRSSDENSVCPSVCL